MGVRERRDSDVEALVGILGRVASDGYPPHRPAGADAFVGAGNELASWVFEMGGVVVGHVAVHRYSARSVMAAGSEATGVPVDELAAVARLFVDPRMRRTGVGRTLLEAASSLAREHGRRPVLDVWERLPGAIALYESAGWQKVGPVDIRFRSPCSEACVHDGDRIRSFVFVGPDKRLT